MRLHPRTQIVAMAENELNEEINAIAVRHDLSSVELLQILAARTQSELRYMLRAERHPSDPTKKADGA